MRFERYILFVQITSIIEQNPFVYVSKVAILNWETKPASF